MRTNSNHIDLTGQVFGRLRVISKSELRKDNRVCWNCICECGTERVIMGKSLVGGKTKSCGCLQRDKAKQSNKDLFTSRVGKIYGRLKVVLDYMLYQEGKHNKHICVCKCECGNVKNLSAYSLASNVTKSCGCLMKERIKECNTKNIDKNGNKLTDTRLYTIWCKMKQRCYNPNHTAYKNYGGRGISICKTWMDKDKGFMSFYNWAVSNGYDDELTLDRIDVNGIYEPSNCKWSTDLEQVNNTRYNVRVIYQGVDLTISQWARGLNINNSTLRSRLRRFNFDMGAILNTYKDMKDSYENYINRERR